MIGMSNQPKRYAGLLIFTPGTTEDEMEEIMAKLLALPAVSFTSAADYNEDETEPHLYFP